MSLLWRATRIIIRLPIEARGTTSVLSRVNRQRNGLAFRNFGDVAAAVKPQSLRRVSPDVAASRQKLPNIENLDNMLLRLDAYVQRTGRVPYADVKEALRVAKEQGKLSSSQCLLLLRSTGMFLRELSPSDRQVLTQQVWNLADKKKLDISHYNALLQVHLENSTDFDPLDYLQVLKDADLPPNRVTYQRLIHRFCDSGNVGGAMKILEFMKSENIAVSERVFNSLISGHLHAGDEQSAKKIFEHMADAQLTPSSETYTVFAAGLASRGNVQGALDALDKKAFSDEQILQIFKAYVVSSLPDMDSSVKILARLPRGKSFFSDVANTCFELLALKKLDAALLAFEKLSPPRELPSGQFFIAQMVRVGFSADEVFRVCQDLKAKGLNELGLLKATQTALASADYATALEYIRLLKAEGFPIRAHYFYPIFCRTSSEDEVYNVLMVMNEMGVTISEQAFCDYVIPRVNFEKPEDVVSRTKAFKDLAEVSINALAKWFLSQGEISKCVSFLGDNSYRFRDSLVTLTASAARANNLKECASLLEKLSYQRTSNQQKVDVVGQFLNAIPAQYFQNAVSAIAERGLSVGTAAFQELQSQGRDVSLLKNIVEDYKHENEYSSPPFALTLEELENHYIDLKNRGMNTQGVLCRLLIRYCRERNVAKAMETLEKLNAKQLSGPAHASLLDLYISCKDLNNALQCYEKVCKIPNFVLDSSKVINLVSLLIENSQMEKASAIMDSHSFENSGHELKGVATRLVQATVDAYGVNAALKAVKEWVPKFTLVSSAVLAPIMRKMLSEDFSTALSTFLKISEEYRITPLKREVCLHLIKNNDTENLDVVTNISKGIHGTVYALVDLASFYIESGLVEPAEQILSELSVDRPHQKLKQVFDAFIERGLIKEVEHLADIAIKTGYNKDLSYYHLMRCYARADKIDKAQELWTKAQEENVVLSRRTLSFLARLLEQNGRPIPFIVPDEFDFSKMSSKNNEGFLDLLNSSLQEALDYRKFAQQNGRSLSISEECALINELVKTDQLDTAIEIAKSVLERGANDKLFPAVRSIRYLLSRLALQGKADLILQIRPLLNEELVRLLAFDDLVCKAYIFSGRALEYVEKLEKTSLTTSIGYGGFESLLRNCPELSDRLYNVAKRFAVEANSTKLLNLVWKHYFIQGKYSNADAVLNEYPALVDNLYLKRVIQHIRDVQDETMSERLMAILCKSTKPRVKGIGICLHIETLLKNQRVQDAYAVLKKALADGYDITDFTVVTLETLKKELALLGEEACFDIPARKNGY